MTSHTLLCEFEDDIYSQEKFPDESDTKFLRLLGEFDVVGKTDIDKKHYKDQTVQFYNISGDVQSVFCYSKQHREAIFVAVGYSHQKIDWNQNIYFNQTLFDTTSVAFRFYTNRLDDWVWQAQVSINADLQHFDWGRYINYDLLLWGRYSYTESFGVHAGFFMETGMRFDRIYPVIGFDWTINDTWKINAVFPMDVGIVYTYDCNWKAALAMRFFDVRHRVGPDEPLPRALVSYRNNGIELAAMYDYDHFIEANVHAGWTIGGKLRISDKQNHHPKHYRLDPAGYFGGEIVVKF